jgi:anthranilate synthase/aminodeoxychorismate synthase-like glutamine amidotransferase
MLMVILIDHYDSFSDMIKDYIMQLGYQVNVIKSDHIDIQEILRSKPTHIILGPGPGHPDDVSVKPMHQVVVSFAGKIPILGICLGHQVIASYYKNKIKHSDKIMHGKISTINHTDDPIFNSIPQKYNVTRYHSFVVDDKQKINSLKVIAKTKDEIMAIRHRNLPIWGVQFHPEAIQTEYGLTLFNNFLQQ